MNKPFFIVAASALAIALIGSVSYVVVQAKSCSGSNHCIAVWVQTDGGKPTIHVSALELHKHGPNHVIFWDIDNMGTSTYKFPDNGIAFMDGDSGTSEFGCDKVGLWDTRFRCKDPKGTIGKYKYTVTVQGTPQPDPLPVNPLDPWVYNE